MSQATLQAEMLNKNMKEAADRAAEGRIEAHRVRRVVELQSLAFQSCHKVT